MVRHHKWRHPCVTNCWRSTVNPLPTGPGPVCRVFTQTGCCDRPSRQRINKSITYRKGLEMWIEWLRNFLPDSGKTHVFMHESTYEQPFLVTMSTSTNKNTYKNKLLGLLLPPPWRKTLREISNFIVKILLYLFCIISLMTESDQYITSFIINVYFRRYYFSRLNCPLTQSGLGWGLSPCQVASWSIQPFGHNKHGPKIRGGSAPVFGEWE